MSKRELKPWVRPDEYSSGRGPWAVSAQPVTEPEWRKGFKLGREERDSFLDNIYHSSRAPRPNETITKQQNKLQGNKRGQKTGAKKRKTKAMVEDSDAEEDENEDEDESEALDRGLGDDAGKTAGNTRSTRSTRSTYNIGNSKDNNTSDNEGTARVTESLVADEPPSKRIRTARYQQTRFTQFLQQTSDSAEDEEIAETDPESDVMSISDSDEEVSPDVDNDHQTTATKKARGNRDLQRGEPRGIGPRSRGRQVQIKQSAAIATATKNKTAKGKTVMRVKRDTKAPGTTGRRRE